MKPNYELLLLYDWGFTPIEVVAMGYNKATAYKWWTTYISTHETARLKLGSDTARLVGFIKQEWVRSLKKSLILKGGGEKSIL